MQHASKLASESHDRISAQTNKPHLTTRSSSHSSDQTCLSVLDADTKIVAANAGDHPLVQQLLVQARHRSLAEDFQSRLDAPNYQPSDRLLLKRKDQIIGHIHIARQIGWFQEQRYPHALLQDFFVLPEFRTAKYGEALLKAAESVAVDEGSALALMHTDLPDWSEQQGWSRCHGHGYSRANTHAILSHLEAKLTAPRRRSSVEVRSWRHYELENLQQVYNQLVGNTWGMLHRSVETWQWLVGRKAHDHILIAVEKNRRNRPDATQEPFVVGYAVIRDSCIVEMLTLPGYAWARTKLVARACRDAIDRDHHFVSIYTPATDPIHELLITAGGSWIQDSEAGREIPILKLLSPNRWVERLYPILHERAKESGIALPIQLEFQLEASNHSFTLTRRSARLEQPEHVDSPISCNWQAFQNLLASNLPFRGEKHSPPLTTPNSELIQTLAALFPAKLLWQSPFPNLRL